MGRNVVLVLQISLQSSIFFIISNEVFNLDVPSEKEY